MRPIALIALLIGSLRVAAAAAIPAAATAEPFKLVREGLPHDALFDIAMDGASGFAIGSFGAVLATTDGGVSWEAQPALGETALTALALAGERVLIVGQRGAIHRREGRGSFEAVASGTRERLLGVALHRSGLAVAVGGFGTVLVSGDGGLGWQQGAVACAPATGGQAGKRWLAETRRCLPCILPNPAMVLPWGRTARCCTVTMAARAGRGWRWAPAPTCWMSGHRRTAKS